MSTSSESALKIQTAALAAADAWFDPILKAMGPNPPTNQGPLDTPTGQGGKLN